MSNDSKKHIFCVECGTKNEVDAKKCVKCHKNPNPKDHAFKDYIVEKVSGSAEDGFFKLAKKFIKKYLYGTLLTCSLVFTGASIITNVVLDNGHIEKFTERPTIKYLGERLKPMEVLTKYIDAARDGNIATMYGLRLENIKPDLYKELLNKPTESQRQTPIESHTIAEFANIYFKDGRDYTIREQAEDMGEYSHGKYGDYEYKRYEMQVLFCENNACDENPNDYSDKFLLADEIELVEVDGNYYVTGEKHHLEQMNLSQVIARGLIYNADGDMTKVDFSRVYDPDLCGEIEDCIEKFGGMEVPQPQY